VLLNKFFQIYILVRIPQISVSVCIRTVLSEFALPWVLRVKEVLALLSFEVVVGNVEHFHLDFNW
jgi:hypothetical protein